MIISQMGLVCPCFKDLSQVNHNLARDGPSRACWVHSLNRSGKGTSERPSACLTVLTPWPRIVLCSQCLQRACLLRDRLKRIQQD